MKNGNIRTSLLAIVLAAAIPPAAATEAVTVPATFQHDLAADTERPTYRLFVAVPPDYEAQQDRRYPVTYVLDGNVTFPFAVSMQRMFALFRETPEMIVVGVGYPVQFFPETIASRWRDLTPWSNRAVDASEAEKLGPGLRSGGGPEFLRHLREEVIPFVDAHYRTTDDRALYGHSFGGLFALYALFEAPDLFRRYAISSPSLNFTPDPVFALEAAYAEAHDALPARVFLSYGSEEHQIAMPVARLVDILEKREYQGLELQAHVFQDETHVSVFPAALSRAVRWLYAAPAGDLQAKPVPAE
ncbi:MAG TPA: alpha/beta hydrolase-fold protein [Woeseiaceae bacterium]|nr:alpha/beta hydrolase-fold protein [Woeseiaceae bacterium]